MLLKYWCPSWWKDILVNDQGNAILTYISYRSLCYLAVEFPGWIGCFFVTIHYYVNNTIYLFITIYLSF